MVVCTVLLSADHSTSTCLAWFEFQSAQARVRKIRQISPPTSYQPACNCPEELAKERKLSHPTRMRFGSCMVVGDLEFRQGGSVERVKAPHRALRRPAGWEANPVDRLGRCPHCNYLTTDDRSRKETTSACLFRAALGKLTPNVHQSVPFGTPASLHCDPSRTSTGRI